MKMKKYLLVFSAAVLSCALAACQMPVANVTGDDILGKNKEHLVVQTSVSMDESNINALLGGQIDQVLVKEGDMVEAGQPLVILNSDSLQAQKKQAQANIEKVQAAIAQSQAGTAQAQAGVEQAQAAYASVVKGATEEQIQQLELDVSIAETNLSSAQTNYETAKLNYDRVKTMYESGVSSQVELEGVENALSSKTTDLENAQSRLEIAQSKLAQTQKGATQEEIARARASVEQAQASVMTAQAGVSQSQATLKQTQAALQELETTLEKCTLKSPISGIVTSVNVKVGDMVSSGLPAAVVTDLYHPYITCNIDETELAQVSLQQPVSITLSASGDTVYPGTVVKINKNADFATKKASNDNGDFDILTYGVKVEFDDAQALQEVLRAGMTAFVDFGR